MGQPQRGRIPRPTVKRLSLYLRELEAQADADQQTISSKQLGAALGLTDAQVRKDLAYFGQFGHPGIGYRVGELTARLRQILRADRTWHAAVVGAGNIGRALMAYQRFHRKGFEIVAVFDSDPGVVGQTVVGHRVRSMADLNFAPVRLDVRDAVSVTSVDFSVALEQLAFQVSLGLTGE
jgi:redox-sensing transcriptional repressor